MTTTLTPVAAPITAPASIVVPTQTEAPTVATPSGGAPNKLYGQRIEMSYEVDLPEFERIKGLFANELPMDHEFPNPELIQTTYLRSFHEEDKARIRIYPDAKEAVFEFKDNKYVNKAGETVDKDAVGAIKVKAKAPTNVPLDTADRLMWGETAADVIGTQGKEGKDLAVSQRAIDLIDKKHVRPVMQGEYTRTTFQIPDVIRVTMDEGISHRGIGALAGAGEVRRGVGILDIKYFGDLHQKVGGILEAELGAGHIRLATDGKGATAVETLAKNLPKYLRHI